ncbi:MAG: hypothetical protein ABSE87_11210 [Terracidiphilus sp.]
MRRFLTLVCFLCLAIPAGISFSGCTRNPQANYCNGQGYGLKITDVASISLQPATTGISMAYGQTRQVASPSALTCKGTAASAGSYTYGTTDSSRQYVDISPTGNICAGNWNRNTGGGIANYTICTPPNPAPNTAGLPYTTAYITASADAVTSNPVEVYVHAPVTSLSLVGPQACLSQGTLWPTPLDVQACYSSNNKQYELCAPSTVNSSTGYACSGGVAPGVSSVPTCSAAIGVLSFSVGTAAIASINSETNQITAEQPGTTVITASVAGSGSSAGYFSTCPPQTINVTLANGSKAGTITQGTTQNLVTTVYDNNLDQCPGTGCPITGLTLDYQSTDPVDITAGAAGAVSTAFPGVASIYAVCQPTTCNPSPINEVGLNGTGLSISSNPVKITTPGTASDYVYFGAPGQSQYFVPVELLTGTMSSTVRLPYVPNSMVMDRTASNLYFGSPHELMVFSTTSASLTKQDPSVPGVVLAVSPNNATLLINDQVRQLFYIYSASAGTSTTFGGLGSSAAWTPDSKTLYITDKASLGAGHTDTLYVYNVNTGWTTYDLTKSTGGSESLAITIPGVGAYLSGSAGFDTVAHTWCPTGTVGNYASMSFYPQSDSVTTPTDVLAATTDGKHILGAALADGTMTLADIGVSIPNTECSVTTNPTTGVQTLSALSTNPTFSAPLNVANVTSATAVNQVIPSPASNLAFITYSGSTPGAPLPYYVPGSGAVNYLTLAGGTAVTAPLAGAFTPDDQLFFVSTAGDNMIHYISVPLVTTNPATADTQQISPNLPACTPVSAGGNDLGCTYSGNGTIVPTTVIAVKPRSTT